jgi:hypothetical protein|tara:strand:+ start:100 stop:330 length:231 start_codon:yes stop_codon:yes gene_type:complete
MNKELIQKQKKFLGLFFGMWALLFLNSAIGWFVIEIGFLPEYFFQGDDVVDGLVALSLFAFTIFQTWVIIKYILKK